MKMSERPKSDRPREKLLDKGAATLSDYELIMAIIGSGNSQADVTKISRDIHKVLKQNRRLTREVLYQVKGLGPAKITELLASFELAGRYLLKPEQPVIDSPEKVAGQLGHIRDKKQEYFVCMTLDGANRLIENRIITIGTLTSSLVHPREVFADAIKDRAASVIVAHNHPSGNLEASVADRDVTNRLIDAGKLLGVTLLDHMIVTKSGYVSIM